MAGRAVFARLTVKLCGRSPVAGRALAANICAQQAVVEALVFGLGEMRPAVIGVTGHAIGAGQRLVEGHRSAALRDRRAFRRADADISDLVACRAAIRRNTGERCMAGKTVAGDVAMG